jgi:tRNA (guanine37-N1)-methyltransferase
MQFDILSLFPDYFEGPFQASILKRAIDKGLLSIRHTDLRGFGEGKHKKVDDRPYGGGAGMVLMPAPMVQAIRGVRKEGSHVVYLSPQGSPLKAATCKRLASYAHVILVCGHYEGLDQRVIETEVDEEISIGDYVLTNGCLPAIVLVDAVARFIPGVLRHEQSAEKESFQEGLLEGPCYTRPENFEGRGVPQVLLNGNHAEIEKWRLEQAMEKTQRVRPDLINLLG